MPGGGGCIGTIPFGSFMAEITLALLGTFELRIRGVTQIAFRSDKARALLAYLAVEADQTHRRDALATLFWEDQGEAAAKTNLRIVLANLRAMFQSTMPNPLHITRHDVTFDPTAVEVDSRAFAGLLQRIQQTTTLQLGLLQAAVALQRGEFLQGLTLKGANGFEEWRRQQQEWHHHQTMATLHELATHFAAQGDQEQTIEIARQQLAREPWLETAHRHLMQALAIRGQRIAALEQYEQCRRVLATELGVEPEAATQALFHRILGDAGRAAPIGVHPTRRTNIPLVATAFLGRDEELAALTNHCLPGQERLVTLLGIGGIGKSRLAQAVGQRVERSWRDGVWWVALEGIQPSGDPANRLAVAIAAAMELPLHGSESAQVQLAAHLQHRQLLLILDNSEHLLSEADHMFALLHNAPAIALLITSRVRLNLPGEHVVAVRGLPAASAAALFVSRARALVPEFAQHAAEQRAIVTICRLVEGLPLGIELAAGWVEHFSCDEIAAALAENRTNLVRRQLPAHSRRTNDPTATRHDSLRVVYENSWQLLSPPEQRILAEVSLFRGEFDRSAAVAIVDANFTDLSTLLSKSLLRLARPGRYSMHEVVRAFSAEKLHQRAMAEQVTIWRRYRTHYLHALGNEPPPQRQQDLANIQAAWGNAVDTTDQSLLHQATAAFAALLRGLGLLQEGCELLQRALAVTGAAVTGAAVTGAGVVKHDEGERDRREPDEVKRDDEVVGDDDIAGELAAALLLEISSFTQVTAGSESALTAARQGLTHTHNPQLRAKLYSRIARLLGETAAWQAAEEAHGQAEAAARRTGDNLLLAGTLYEHAHTQVIHFVGDFQQAIKRLELTLALVQAEPAADTLQIKILRGLAMAYMRYGNYGQARGYAQQCLSLAEQQAVRLEQIDALNQLSLAAWFAGLYEDALRYLQAALPLAEEVGDREAVGIIRCNLCLVQRNIGHLEEAVAQGQAALVPLQELGAHRFEGLCRNRIGHTLLALARPTDAAAMYVGALAIWQHLDNPNRFEALAGLAVARQRTGAVAAALPLAEEVLAFAVGDALLRVVEPVQMLLHCAEVLAAAGEAGRRDAVLAQAAQWIDIIANRNDDPTVRTAYRQNIPAHRVVVALTKQITHGIA